MRFISSEGGPFICLEQQLEPVWGGVERLTLSKVGAQTDYDRACKNKGYINILPVSGDEALFFMLPFDTSFSKAPSGANIIVQIECSGLNFDKSFDDFISNMDESIFDRPDQALNFAFQTSSVSVFDAGETGSNVKKNALRLDFIPGTYRVRTRQYEPDNETSLVMHKFDLA